METNLSKRIIKQRLRANLRTYRTEGNFYNITDYEFWKTLAYHYAELDFYASLGMSYSPFLENIIAKYSSK